MPLPKRPAKRGDVLTDYGPEADLTKPAGKAAPKAAAKPSQAPETASKPLNLLEKGEIVAVTHQANDDKAILPENHSPKT